MPTSEILRDKLILAVHEEKDVLEIIEEEISFEVENATLHCATSFEIARQYLLSYTYDLALLDIVGVQGFDLLEIAARTSVPTVVLTAHAFTPDALSKSIELGARAFLPLEKLGSLVPFLEDVLKLNYQTAWKKPFDLIGALFDRRYGADWRRTQEELWTEVGKRLTVEAYIIK